MISEFNGWKDIWQVLNVILFNGVVLVLVFVPVKLH